MAKRSSSDSGGFLFKTGLFALLAGLGFFIFNKASGKKAEPVYEPRQPVELRSDKTEAPAAATPSTVSETIFPSATGEIVRHRWYALSYSEDHEQAEWVAYELTRDRLNEKWAERPNTFRPDPDVRTESATPRDYSSSGFDKGHLCPAADMAFDESAIDETFFMSNMSPQVPAFNMGVWRELEELTRDWARKFNRLYVVTGPVLAETALAQIGFSKISVPASYYKVLLAPESGRAIAFILPNRRSDRPVMEYACNIDRVETATGLDFFPQLLKGMDEELEASLDKDAWPVNKQWYEKRVKEWNLR